MDALTNDQVADKLSRLNGWSLQGQCIEKTFEFVDFAAAMNFMNRLAPVAERLGHHPDWSNTYNKVHISLTSHDIGGLTDADFRFAAAADEVSSQAV